MLLDMHDGHDLPANNSISGLSGSSLVNDLDTFKQDIFGATPLKNKLQEKHGHMTHYEQLLAVRPGGVLRYKLILFKNAKNAAWIHSCKIFQVV